MFSLNELSPLGWDDVFLRSFHETIFNLELDPASVFAAKVIGHERDLYRLALSKTESRPATLRGKMRHEANRSIDLPAIGDWVIASFADQESLVVEGLLRRKTLLSRTAPGGGEQAIAANIDTVFIATSLNEDFSRNRIDRYVALVRQSGSEPVIVLTKGDLSEEGALRQASLAERHPSVSVFVTNHLLSESFAKIADYAANGRTVAVVGSSGVGKSTLINFLVAGEQARTSSIREGDGKGRHTTTSRAVYPTRNEGWIIDTPGMREIQMTGDDSGLDSAFADIVEIAESCRFRDCQHGQEPGCAIRESLESGDLEASRWESYKKLEREIAFQASKNDRQALAEQKQKWKKIHAQVQAKMEFERKNKLR